MEYFSDMWHLLVAICLAIAPVVAAILFSSVVLMICGRISNIWVKREIRRESKLRQQAEMVVDEISNEIDAVHSDYEGKYMPFALAAELKAAREAMITLRIRSWGLSRQSEVVEVVDKAAVVLDDIRALSARPMTEVEHEANRLFLVAELAQLEVNTQKEQATVEKTYGRQLDLLLEKRDSERLRIAKSQELLAASAFI